MELRATVLCQFVRDGELFRAVAVATPDGHRVTSTVGRLLGSQDSLKTNAPNCGRAQEWKELEFDRRVRIDLWRDSGTEDPAASVGGWTRTRKIARKELKEL